MSQSAIAARGIRLYDGECDFSNPACGVAADPGHGCTEVVVHSQLVEKGTGNEIQRCWRLYELM
jgi:hypothetical protein